MENNRLFQGTTTYQIGLALLVLYFLLRYVPYGVELGLLILLGGILMQPKAGEVFGSFLSFIQGKQTNEN